MICPERWISMAWESISKKQNKANKQSARCQWLIPIILATWEAEIRRMEV
jgi:hypothetical protein